MRHNGGKHDDAARRPDEILAEIEHTRGEMDSTLSAIEQRLTPGQLMDQGLDYLKNSGANEFIQNLGGQVKSNPMPIALVGIGLAWLMASGRSQPSHSSYQSSGPGLGERAGEMKDQLKERVNETTQAMRDRASGALDSARSTLDSAKSTMSQASQRMSDLSQSAREGMSSLGQTMREQPLALGAVGLAVGALMAAMAPRTRQEDELMGDARDQLTPASSGVTSSSAKPPQPQTFAPPAAPGDAADQAETT